MAGCILTRRSLLSLVLVSTIGCGLMVTGGWSAPPAAGHAHPDKGPHGGSLLELGDEEYHIEVVLDEKGATLTLYVLDAAAKGLVAIESKDVLLNLKHGGKPVQFKLPALRQKSDPAGQASCFQLKSKELVHDLHHKDHGARLALKVQGKSYTTKFELAHDHDHKHE